MLNGARGTQYDHKIILQTSYEGDRVWVGLGLVLEGSVAKLIRGRHHKRPSFFRKVCV